jgi:phospholipid/cholesterol/gamma-HCH transport system substrate-binding protein
MRSTALSRFAATTGRRVLGIAFVALVVVLLALSVATYLKVFTDIVPVTLRATTVGNQLSEGADIKVRGVLVGEVRDVRADGKVATLKLAMKPETIDQVPANVSARLLPKTLFGEKYVELVVPDKPANRPLHAGDVIGQDRSQTAIELQRVLDDLLPVLRAVPPEKISATLSALVLALEGRGDRIGNNLVELGNYLRDVNPHMDTIRADFRGLATFGDTYADAAPDLIALLRNFTATSGTIFEQRRQLAGFLAATRRVADTTRVFLDANEDQIITVTAVGRPTLELLAQYSPEFPCLLGGLADLEPRIEDTLETGRLHITLEIVRDNGKYERNRDEPVYGAKDGPNCRGLPNPPVPFPEVTGVDGYDHAPGRRGPPVPPVRPPLPAGGDGNPLAALTGDGGSGGGQPADMGLAGTSGEREVMNALLAPMMGTPTDRVPDIATLLVGPMVRGANVRVVGEG